jgi:hypothetical protein
MIPYIRHLDIGLIPTSEHRYSDIDPDIRALRYRVSNSDIGHFISDIRYNIGYNIGGPDIGV